MSVYEIKRRQDGKILGSTVLTPGSHTVSIRDGFRELTVPIQVAETDEVVVFVEQAQGDKSLCRLDPQSSDINLDKFKEPVWSITPQVGGDALTLYGYDVMRQVRRLEAPPVIGQ